MVIIPLVRSIRFHFFAASRDIALERFGIYNFTMNIRAVQDDDYPAIARLRRETIRHVNAKDYSEEVIDNWSSTVGAQDFRKNADECKRWVALEKDRIIGFCEHSLKCELSRMYVHKDHLRKGVGSRLLEVAEEFLKEQGCREIRIESTITAKDFYEKNGYKVLKKNFYKGNANEPAYKMSKRLHWPLSTVFA